MQVGNENLKCNSNLDANIKENGLVGGEMEVGCRVFLTVVCIQVNGGVMRSMEEGRLSIQMEIVLKGSGKEEKPVVLECIRIIMEQYMKVTGSKTNRMVRDCKNGQMVVAFKDSLKMVRNMVLGLIYGQMAVIIPVDGRKIN